MYFFVARMSIIVFELICMNEFNIKFSKSVYRTNNTFTLEATPNLGIADGRHQTNNNTFTYTDLHTRRVMPDVIIELHAAFTKTHGRNDSGCVRP